jgi:hypothetical protein
MVSYTFRIHLGRLASPLLHESLFFFLFRLNIEVEISKVCA